MKNTMIPVLGLILSCSCGASLTPKEQTAVTVSIDAAVCILNHITESPPQIAIDCLGDASLTSQVVTLLAAHKAAEIREISQDGGS